MQAIMASGSSSTGLGPNLPDSMISAPSSSKLQGISLYNQELRQFQTRKARCASRLASLTTSSSVSDFLEVKIEDTQAEVDYCSTLRDILDEAVRDKILSRLEWDELSRSAQQEREAAENELHGIKKQRKIIEEDLEDITNGKTRAELEEAYSHLLGKYIQQPSEDFRGFNKQQRVEFRRGVCEHLSATRYVQIAKTRVKQVWCHALSACIQAHFVAAAHLVPASLEGEEMSYTFGVDQLSLTNPLLGKFWK